MTSPIDPLRRSPNVRRTRKSAGGIVDDTEAGEAGAEPGLPVPVGPARTVPPKTPAAGAASIEAQLNGERRGLRAGPSVIDEARHTYNRTEWSGSKDRRAPKGRAANTEI